MQLIAESYDLLRHGAGLEVPEIAERFRAWNESELESFLIEISARVLAKTDDRHRPAAGRRDPRRGRAEGHGPLDRPERARARGAADRDHRGGVRAVAERAQGSARPRPPTGWPARRPTGQATPALVDDLEHALYASKIVSYAQGFAQMAAAAESEGWDIDLGSMATIWRGGCIIRARFLDRIREAYDDEPALANLMLADFFASALARPRTRGAAWWRAPPSWGSPPRPSPRRWPTTTATAGPAGPASPDPGPARPVRRPHLPARRPRRHLPHHVGRGRPRGRGVAEPGAAAPREKSGKSKIALGRNRRFLPRTIGLIAP